MGKQLTAPQTAGLLEGMRKLGFDASVTAEIVGFVRQRNLANWAISPGATPAAAPTKAPTDEQDEILTSLASLGAISGEHDGSAAAVGGGGQDGVLATLDRLGVLAAE